MSVLSPTITPAARPSVVWHLPNFATSNPYQSLLAAALRRRGVEVILRESPPTSAEWERPGAPRVVHLHWVHPLFLPPPGKSGARWLAGWVRWLVRVRGAGLRLVWTVHQVRDHERRNPWIDRIGTAATASAAHRCIVHNRASAEALRRATGRWSGVSLIPHGHYADAYLPGRSRAEVRREWGVPETAFMVLFVGGIRRYKGVELLIEAFSGTRSSAFRLVLAGAAWDGAFQREIEAAAARDPRIVTRFGFLPPERLRETVEAADVMALPFESQISSGSALLGLSFGRRVLVPALPAFREIQSWPGVSTFVPTVAGSLRRLILDAATGTPPEPERIERAVRAWDWDRIAGATARCYGMNPGVECGGPPPGRP